MWCKSDSFKTTGDTAQRSRCRDEPGKHKKYPRSKPTNHGFTKSCARPEWLVYHHSLTVGTKSGYLGIVH